MKKYYYVCPRCGRKWRFFFRRDLVRCAFCSEEWDPYASKYAKLTSSRFSFTVCFFWLVILLAIAFGGLKVAGYDGVVIDKAKALFGSDDAPAQIEEKPAKTERWKERSSRPWATRDENGVKKTDEASDNQSGEATVAETPVDEASKEIELPVSDASDEVLDEAPQQVVPSAKSDAEW